ncbi:UNVERIFIED_CONTAM: hypothetical protein Sindi_1973700, partial [Sesamum indicum]
RNAGKEDTSRKGIGTTIQLTQDELQKMMEEASQKAIVEYERRTATPLVKETARRQLFENVEPLRESRVQGEQEHRSKRPASSGAGSSSHSRAKRREPIISRAEVESVAEEKRGEIVSQNKNSPFCNDILIQTVEPGFRVPDLRRYDGMKDPQEHVAAFEMLIQKFNFHFASKKKQKRSATHLFNIRQREDEALRNFMGRFNNETLEVQELRIDMLVSIFIHGLRKGPFTSALARDVEQLMALAQKYIDEEEMNAMKDSKRRDRDYASRRPHENREGGGNKQKQEKQKEPKYIPKYHNCTPLAISREKALMMVENADVLKWPRHTRRSERWGLESNTKKVRANCRIEPGKRFVLKVEDEEAISFDSSDRLKDGGDQNDPMVVKLDIANFTVHKVLIDSGSSVDIIFKSVVDKMGLENARLEPVKTPLVGFGGSEVASLGTIELPVSMGEEPKRKTLMVKFLVVDTPFTYNVILGRPGLNSFRAVISTYHMKMKFPTEYGIGEVSCDQKEARKCYNLSLKGEQKPKKQKTREDAEPRPYEAEHLKPSEEYKTIQLVPEEPSKTTRIGSSMNDGEMAMIEFLRKNADMFAWSPSDFTGIVRRSLCTD